MQSVVILSLSLWIVEEYLNNMYLREYVSGVFQAEGLMFGSSSEKTTTTATPSVEVQKPSVLDQLTPSRQEPMTGPRPLQTGATFPQRPFYDLRPQAPTGPGIEQVGPFTPRPIPVLRPLEPARSAVLQSPQTPAPQTPTNVTTVITGIMPAQKQIDPGAPPDEKPASQ